MEFVYGLGLGFVLSIVAGSLFLRIALANYTKLKMDELGKSMQDEISNTQGLVSQMMSEARAHIIEEYKEGLKEARNVEVVTMDELKGNLN